MKRWSEKAVSVDFKIGRGRSIYEPGVYFSPMKENSIDSDNSVDILKTDADVHFEIKFGRNVLLKLLFWRTNKSKALQSFFLPRVHGMDVLVHFQNHDE